ncbi:RecQ family ATP-dependent DNA helicase (plasmid) [Alteromonas macleodii]|uniref:RecQ family ATP-dependent DNA helicase n=1 Tax=Alteromonas macleodii TaxID=28108 RepID=UPI0030D2BC96
MNSHTLLEKYFGYRDFRPGQKPIIDAVMGGRDVFALMQTGGGKSLCFQIPALSKNGICLVICPLISLMYDQVRVLKRKNISAAYLNSQQDYKERSSIEQDAINGKLKFLYVAPERLLNDKFLDILKQMTISMIVYDEAHVITEWGEAFRPGYIMGLNKIKELEDFFKRKHIDPQYRIQKIALSASIIAEARKDIIEKTNLFRPAIFINSFSRNNIELNVSHYQKNKLSKIDILTSDIKAHPKTTSIVYANTRKECEVIAGKLAVRNIKATHYHAGIPPATRKSKMDLFMTGKVDVIVCTSAFGMGIDKKNVRQVYHWNLPSTIEDMYQEMGRAGRDGLKSRHMVFYDRHDIEASRERLLNNYPTAEAVNKMYQFLSIYVNRINDNIIEEDKHFLADIVGEPVRKECISSIFDHLQRIGFLSEYRQHINPHSTQKKNRIFEVNIEKSHDIQLDSVSKRYKAAVLKFEKLTDYFEGDGCRNHKLLSYLGEPQLENVPISCSHCDKCLGKGESEQIKPESSNDDSYRKNLIKKRIKGLVESFAKKNKIPANVILPPNILSKITSNAPKTKQDLIELGLNSKTVQTLGDIILEIINKK